MKRIFAFVLLIILSFCTPKGPQTFSNPFVGKTKSELISAKGQPSEIKVYDKSEVYIYRKREEYFGTKTPVVKDVALVPKKVYVMEKIYYINEKDIIYKFQLWRRRIN